MPRPRRSQVAIEAAALECFSERGYGGVSIDEIGARAGVSGPAVYQYFPSKGALLAAVLEPGVAHTRRLAEAAVAKTSDSRAALSALVRSYVSVGIGASDRFDLYFREEHNLPNDARVRLRRESRRFVDTWVAVLADLRPDLTNNECRVVVRGVVGLVTTAIRESEQVETTRRAAMVEAMTLAALLAKPPPGSAH